MNPNGQTQEPGRGLRQVLAAWVLWVLAVAVGGAVGGASTPLEFFGPIFVWGVALGIAQALVLLRHLPLEVVGAWLGASIVGWIVGWVVLVVARVALVRLVPEMNGQLGVQSTRILLFGVWATFAVFQGAALALAFLALERRYLLPLAALWLLAGILGGALAVAASSYLTNTPVLPGQIIPSIVAQAVAGALYDAVTGIVLVMIARRWTG